MAESTPEPGQFNWMLPLCAALVMVAIYVSMALWGEDAYFWTSLLLIAPGLILVSVTLIIFAVIRKGRQKRQMLLSTATVLWVTAVAMFFLTEKYGFELRTTARWLLWSQDYKAQVLSRPPLINGDFKHIEWDGWGIVPTGFTTVYLVFDPTDSLSSAAKSRRAGKFHGIPCEVPEVDRLEKQWYTVIFYTDEDWNHCD